MSKREQIEADIKATNNRIEEIVSEIANLKDDTDKYEDELDAILDEEDDVVICRITFCRSRILKELDAVGYRQELLNYVDALRDEDLVGFDELKTEQEELDSKLVDLKDELDGLCPDCGSDTTVEIVDDDYVDDDCGDGIHQEKCCSECDWRVYSLM